MPYPDRKGTVYYLIFAIGKPVAKRIITDIFKKAKEVDYKGKQYFQGLKITLAQNHILRLTQ
jgi:hypothetical protein